MPLPTVPLEPQQGEIKEREQLEQGAPPSLEPSPAQADKEALDSVIAPEPEVLPSPPEPPIQTLGLSQPETGPTSVMWRIPHDYGSVLGYEHKPLPQREEDIGLLWQALAADPRVHPLVRIIASGLLPERKARG